MDDGVLVIRAFDPERDLNFVTSAWLKSFRDSRFIGVITPKAYWTAYQATLEEILCRPGVKVDILSPSEDRAQILGFCVSEARTPACIHYVYIKHDTRRSGLAWALLENALPKGCKSFDYTFRTAKSHWFAKRYLMNWSPKIVTEAKRQAGEAHT